MHLSAPSITMYARQLTHTGALYANPSHIFTIEFTHTNTIILSNEACHFIIPTLYLADIHAIMQACYQDAQYTLIHKIHHPYFSTWINIYSYHNDPNHITCAHRSLNLIGGRILRPQPRIYINHRNTPISTIMHDISTQMHAYCASNPPIPSMEYTPTTITCTHPPIANYPHIHTMFHAKGIFHSPHASIEIGICVHGAQADGIPFIIPGNNTTILNEKYHHYTTQLMTNIYEHSDTYAIGQSQHAQTTFLRAIQQSFISDNVMQQLQRCVHDIYHHYHYIAP